MGLYITVVFVRRDAVAFQAMFVADVDAMGDFFLSVIICIASIHAIRLPNAKTKR